MMQDNIHPEYRTVVFHDTSIDEYFLIGSTLQTDRTIEWKDGKTYPYFTVEVSYKSHPFYTGKQRVIHQEGRVANLGVDLASFRKETSKESTEIIKKREKAPPDCQIVLSGDVCDLQG